MLIAKSTSTTLSRTSSRLKVGWLPAYTSSPVTPATGVWPEYEPVFAADGIDELITGFGQRRKYRPSADRDGSMQVCTTDTGHAWHVGTEDGRIQARRQQHDSPASAACTITGPASGVYLFLWNRSDAATAGVTISGAPGFLELWQSSVRVRWG